MHYNQLLTRTLKFLLLVCCYLMFNCTNSPLENNGGIPKTGTVRLSIAAAKSNVNSLAKRLSNDKTSLAKALADSGLNIKEMVSFTPSSLIINITTVTLYTEWEFDEGNQQYMGRGVQLVLEVNQPIDLLKNQSLSDLFRKTFIITEEKLGEYVALYVGTEPTMTISGEVTVNNKQYTMTNMPLENYQSIPYSYFRTPLEIGYSLVDPATIDTLTMIVDSLGDTVRVEDTLSLVSDNLPSMRIIFDPENVLYLAQFSNPGPPGSPGLLEDNLTSVTAENVMILPWVGNDTISLEKYKVSLNDTVKTCIRVTLALNPAREILTGNWQAVFLEGFNESTDNAYLIQPTSLEAPKITDNGDGSFYIQQDPDFYGIVDTSADNRTFKLPAFRLESHNGTLSYGGQDYGYIAVKLD